MAWEWSNDWAPEGLHNGVLQYPVDADNMKEYKQEFHIWMDNGWLVPYPEENLRPLKGLIPLMAMMQQDKAKVCPMMDY